MSVESRGPTGPEDRGDASSHGEEGEAFTRGEDARVVDVAGRAARTFTRAGEEKVHPSVLRVRAVGASRSVEDANLIDAVAVVVEAVRVEVSDRRGLVGTELGRTQQASVEQEVRNHAVAELQLSVGLGVAEARAMVSAATAPEGLRDLIDAALRSGEASWPLVRAFIERTSRLGQEQQLLIAQALFGPDVAVAHEDRLDPDGLLHGLPWGHARFKAALDAEATGCESTDPDSERQRRAKAYAARRTTLRVHEDGTATLRITGPAASMVAVNQRIDRAARLLRRAGDERTLEQLRADTANAVLLYGTIDLPTTGTAHVNTAPELDDEEQTAPHPERAAPGQPAPEDAARGDAASGEPAPRDAAPDNPDDADDADDADDDGDDFDGLFDETLAPEDIGHIARVVNALPLVALQVIVPYSSLAGGFPLCAGCSNPTDRPPPPGSDPPADGAGQESALRHGPREDSAHPPLPPRPLGTEPPHLGGQDRGRREQSGRGKVAEVLGPHPFFITDNHARELALLPGTTLHRLVVDPRDGRLVERTIAAYRPDADMRRQVLAADVYSRAPGSRIGAHAGELDHVTPYGWAGGPTTELNLALLAKRPHQFKTDGAWDAAINDRRDLTITTVLGQVVTTRVHDYRTYLRTRHPDDLHARRDLANRLTYAALAQRSPQRDRATGRPADGLTLQWTTPTGATLHGPSPTHPTLDDLLNHDLLNHEHADEDTDPA